MKEDTQLQFNVDLNTFSGPLDILLDLAKSQKVNLENISITIKELSSYLALKRAHTERIYAATLKS